MEGIRGLMGEKGLVEEDWNDRRLEKEDIIIVQWEQEDVETSYNLLNNNIIQSVSLYLSQLMRLNRSVGLWLVVWVTE
jgi:hypothetical protein